MDTEYLSNEELVVLYQQDKDLDIRNKIIMKNIGLVYSAARKRLKIPTCYTLEDLAQEGVFGMIRSIEKFDPTKNTSFSTYSYYWITQYMDRSLINNGYMIRLPVYLHEKLNALFIAENNYALKNIGVDLKTLCKEIDITEDEYYMIDHYRKNYCNHASLNIIINQEADDSYTELQDYIPNPSISTEDLVISQSLKSELNKALDMLPPKEKNILKLRFGLNGYAPSTLESIGDRYNLTRERIRQIENKALKRISRLNLKTGLKDYLTGI
ncbi:MAG TPA: sigma-70 family RNA polymerase sigma factor [Tepidimicrobium sp.]|nr:sigma-70 family RNA polymerase sigma factor [Tepidimicrobium sp.]